MVGNSGFTGLQRAIIGLATLIIVLVAPPAQSAVVMDCDAWAGAEYLIEPWEDTSQTFSRGSIRVAVVDLGEPPCCTQHFIVLMPANLYGGRVCTLVARTALVPNGWTRVGIEEATAERTPASGLRISVPVYGLDPSTGGADPNNRDVISVLVRQAAGTVTLEAAQ